MAPPAQNPLIVSAMASVSFHRADNPEFLLRASWRLQVFELDRHLKASGLANKENVPWDGGLANSAGAPVLDVIRRLVREIHVVTDEAHKVEGECSYTMLCILGHRYVCINSSFAALSCAERILCFCLQYCRRIENHSASVLSPRSPYLVVLLGLAISLSLPVRWALLRPPPRNDWIFLNCVEKLVTLQTCTIQQQSENCRLAICYRCCLAVWTRLTVVAYASLALSLCLTSCQPPVCFANFP